MSVFFFRIMDRPEKWTPEDDDDGEEEEGEDIMYEDEEGEGIAPLPARVPQLQLDPAPPPFEPDVVDVLQERFARAQDMQRRGRWNARRQGIAERTENRVAGSEYRLRIQVRLIVRTGNRMLLRLEVEYAAHAEPPIPREETALRIMRDEAARTYSLLNYKLRGPLQVNPTGSEVRALDRLEFATRMTVRFYEEARMGREGLYPGLHRGPRLYPRTSLEEGTEWIIRGAPNERMLEALLNALMIDAWSGTRSAFTETDLYQEVEVFVGIFGTENHKHALAVAVNLARIARKHAHPRSGKRKLLKRTKGIRL